MKGLVIIFMAGILTDNFILTKFLGICPFLGVSNKFKSAAGMGIAVTLVMTLATAVTWQVQDKVLVPYDLKYLQTLVFILMIASIVQILETVLRKYSPGLYKSLGVYLPLITTNCAVLGVTVLNIDADYTYVESLVNALGGGAGFLVAILIFAGIRYRLDESSDPTPAFKGIPVTLISASILSLAFSSFGGVIENIFG